MDQDGDGWDATVDCDDNDPAVNPGQAETDCDGIDNDCDPTTEDEPDGDGDGASVCVDCDDADPLIHPGAFEACNGLDDDCDGSPGPGEVDADGDGFLVCDGDCDDGDPAIYPGAAEACNGLDDDCDGYPGFGELDGDVDGFRVCDGDCDDGDPAVFPGAPELCNGEDDDCDGSPDYDEIDGDGDGFMMCDLDCDDANPAFYPGAPELCDGLDGDCDGAIPADEVDGDGDGLAPCEGDCNDGDPAVHPGATEICNGEDDDCDGSPGADELDGDGDGWLICEGDCDDADPAVFPGAPELCNGEDDDCDGGLPADEADADGDGSLPCEGDCDDGDPAVYPGAPELCNGLDDDCDGVADLGSCNALEFDGGDRVTVPSSAGLDLTTSASFEAWFRFGSDPYTWTHDRAYLLDRAGSYRLWYSPVGTGNSVEDQFFCDLWDWEGPFTDQGQWETDRWYHIACTWDGSTATVYVDGVAHDSVTVVKTLPGVASDLTLGMGADPNSGFIGVIDEVRVWDVVRGEEQVREAICAVDGSEVGLRGVWTFEEGAGQTTADLAGLAGDGWLGVDAAVEASDPTWIEEAPDCFEHEWCDGLDNDGDGLVDEDGDLIDAPLWYLDADGDGFGDDNQWMVSCAAPDDHVADPGDCDDGDPAVHPDAEDICNGIDDNCDGILDGHGAASLHFDGSDDTVYVGDDPLVNLTAAITMEAWVYSQDPGNDEPVLAKEHSGGQQQYGFGVYYDHFGLLLCDGSGWGLNERASGAITADTWTHIASTWDGTSWANYQDGLLVGSGTYTGSVPSTGQPLTFGTNSTYDYTRFAGYITDVRLWDVARSQDQIQDNMVQIVDSSGLVGWWPMDAGAGQVAYDLSGNGLDGRLGADPAADGRDPAWATEVPLCGNEWCNGVDDDGDGLIDDDDPGVLDPVAWFQDDDGDGYGQDGVFVDACVPPAGYAGADGDCDDTDPTVNPGAGEAVDGLDNDCDGLVDEHGVTSLYFDGIGDMVWIGDQPEVNITGPITMEAWVSPTHPGSDEPVLAKEYSGGQQQYWFGVWGNGFGLLLGDGGGWGLWARTSGSVVADEWTHIASTWDGAAWTNYQDGVEVDSGAYNGTIPGTGQPLTIGINSAYDGTRYQGYITDVRLYDVARTDAQVFDNMWGLTDTTGLVGWWTFDDASGQIAADDSGNGLDGQLGADPLEDARDPSWASELPEP